MGLRERIHRASVLSAVFDGQDPFPEGVEEEFMIVDTTPPRPAEPLGELVITKQWGLLLPGGDIAWNSWQGIPFDNPLDRLHMVAKLQATANDVGWHQDEFLARYGWVTRNQIARVCYEDTGCYGLTDSEASQPEDIAITQEEEQ